MVGAALRERVLGDDGDVVATLRGVRPRRGPLRAARIRTSRARTRWSPADFVSMDDGTGIVHIAPAFGPEDLAVGRAQGWPVFKPVDDDGAVQRPARRRSSAGSFVKDADPHDRPGPRASAACCSRAGTIEHAYPFCWRCGTPLLYYARSAWYARTTAVKERLLAVNDAGELGPRPHQARPVRQLAGEQRGLGAVAGALLGHAAADLAVCGYGQQTAIGSLTELGDRAGRDVRDVDPHRPAIDEVTFPCPECGEDGHAGEGGDRHLVRLRRDAVRAVELPPRARPRSRRCSPSAFPADFITEAIDQTRGWFYTLMAEGVLHFDSTAYRNVVCLGHLVADGRPEDVEVASATRFDPWEALDRQGADALRWWMITNGSPWESRRIGHEVLDAIVRQFMLTLWNIYAFFVTYANATGSTRRRRGRRWPNGPSWTGGCSLSSRARSGPRVNAWRPTTPPWRGAGSSVRRRPLELVRPAFARRFWDPEGAAGTETTAAFATLECLVAVAGLLAPFLPFTSEELWRNLGPVGRSPVSVHLSDFPAVHEAAVDPGLDESMDLARRLVELGRRVRVETKTRIRQPLLEAVVHTADRRGELEALLPLVAEELNVKRVRIADADEVVRSVARETQLQGSRSAPRSARQAARRGARDRRRSLAAPPASGGSGDVADRRGSCRLALPRRRRPRPRGPRRRGVASEGGTTVALELEITRDLRLEGLARELVRAVQDARKAAGLQVGDRIVLGLEVGSELAASVHRHRDEVARETLAVEVVDGAGRRRGRGRRGLEGQPVTVTLRRV